MDKYIIVYNKYNGLIFDILQADQKLSIYFKYYPQEIIDSMGSITFSGELPININDYVVRNSNLVKLSMDEINELSLYKRLLTEDERQLEKLKPSPEEVKKAENTIEILTLIQEVM